MLSAITRVAKILQMPCVLNKEGQFCRVLTIIVYTHHHCCCFFLRPFTVILVMEYHVTFLLIRFSFLSPSAKLPSLCNASGASEASSFNVPEVLEQVIPTQLIASRALTMKDCEQQIADLKKENFSLKLRIYFLEERVQRGCEEDLQDVYRTNIELKVEAESLRRELKEKKELLLKASDAVEVLAAARDAEALNVRQEASSEVQQLREEKRLLEQAVLEMREEAEHMAQIAEADKLRVLQLQSEMQAAHKVQLSEGQSVPDKGGSSHPDKQGGRSEIWNTLQDSQVQNGRLQAENECLGEQHNSLRVKNCQLETEKRHIQMEYGKLQVGSAHLHTEKTRLETENGQLQKENNHLEMLNRQLQAENSKLQVGNNYKEKENVRLVFELEQKRAESGKLTELMTLQSLETQVAKLQEELIKSHQERLVLQEHLKKEKVRCDELRQSLKHVSEERQDEKNDSEEHNRLVNALEQAQSETLSLRDAQRTAEAANQELLEKLAEKEEKMSVQEQNILKRDKAIQGLTMALRAKDKEMEELCTQIEEKDGALASARDLAHKAQMAKFQGTGEQQALLNEKQEEELQLHACLLQCKGQLQAVSRELARRTQELAAACASRNAADVERDETLSDLHRCKHRLQELRETGRRQQAEASDREYSLSQRYDTLLAEEQRQRHSQELLVARLSDSLKHKDSLLQEYLEMLKSPSEQCEDGTSVLISKLRERLKDREQALERAFGDQVMAVQDKEKEISDLRLTLRERESNLERMQCLLRDNEASMTSLDEIIREKDKELQQLATAYKDLQRERRRLEEEHASTLADRDSLTTQQCSMLDILSRDLQVCCCNGFSMLSYFIYLFLNVQASL
uniref:Centrosomin N-terminal motif 1 domain-containing protein n=1 Tax=Eptatretus burgeri TaxID=7764 RepID=A0A8C4R3J2_EPTBU